MLRKTLVSACLLLASGSVLANDESVSRHGITVTPNVSITLGSGHHNNGYRENSYSRSHNDYVPRPVHVQPVYYNNYYRGNDGHHQGRDSHRREWRGNDRHYYGDRNRGYNRGHH